MRMTCISNLLKPHRTERALLIEASASLVRLIKVNTRTPSGIWELLKDESGLQIKPLAEEVTTGWPNKKWGKSMKHGKGSDQSLVVHPMNDFSWGDLGGPA
jgi:hypothetical protein